VHLTEVVGAVDVVETRGAIDGTVIHAIDFDSRSVRLGSLFCCLPGATVDGHDHAAEAVAAGASALLCERFVPVDVPQVRVAPGTVRPAMAEVAATFFDYPARHLQMVGVTGTNGKTTVAQLVRSVLDTAGVPSGLLGTLTGERTTPESPVLQAALDRFRSEGRRAVAMEVSSHALTQHRVDGIVFDVAGFTNLSHDHLDHHLSMEAYFAAKASLFTPERCRLAVVNVDDPWGERLAGQVAGVEVVPVRRSDASQIALSVGASSFRWRGHEVTVALTGVFNIDNSLMAAAIGTSLGIDESTVVEGLSRATPPAGRMEVVTAGPPFAVLVDFAHTPAGLGVALASARRLAGDGRVVCLFGCGGDRDAAKRPLMGEVAGRMADVTVLTSDNPRSEDPVAIIDQVRAGVGGGTELLVEPDRRTAIRLAIVLARPGDVLVLAGKGHETAQVTAEGPVPFDDRQVARQVLAETATGEVGNR
jgi:UDP-N-acetylmuramoyl-L-alanyl-D-glutamate--2,6-diaminopimelate ligase